MMATSFFDESSEQSQIKAQIVSKYFWAWAKVITSSPYVERIAYIDLFAGPGRYKDGTQSTPLLILKKAIADPKMRKMLVTMFNDKDIEAVRSLESEIEEMEGVKQLKYQPDIYNESVGEEIVQRFEEMSLVPTLIFVDPWGYKGLSLRLINSVLKDWGSECIFFFNYNRINMGITNQCVKEHMDALFGEDCADDLRCSLQEETYSPTERELLIVEKLAQALKDMGGKYVLPFRFRNAQGKRASHHLIFVSKDVKGYEIMKDVMARESTSANQGVPSFEYNPVTRRQPLLFELTRPLDYLADDLVKTFAGETLHMRQVYERHHVGKPFIKKNYKDALVQLENAKRIVASPPITKRRKYRGIPTCSDNVIVEFPKRKKIKKLKS